MRIKIYYAPTMWRGHRTLEGHCEDAKSLFMSGLSSGKFDRIYFSEKEARENSELRDSGRFVYFEFELEIQAEIVQINL